MIRHMLKQPTKPRRPAKPKAPSDIIPSITEIDTRFSNYEGYNFDAMIRSLFNLPEDHVINLKNVFIKRIADYYDEVAFTYDFGEISNSNYDKQYKAYLKKFKTYNDNMLRYNEKLAAYKIALVTYEDGLKEQAIRLARET